MRTPWIWFLLSHLPWREVGRTTPTRIPSGTNEQSDVEWIVCSVHSCGRCRPLCAYVLAAGTFHRLIVVGYLYLQCPSARHGARTTALRHQRTCVLLWLGFSATARHLLGACAPHVCHTMRIKDRGKVGGELVIRQDVGLCASGSHVRSASTRHRVLANSCGVRGVGDSRGGQRTTITGGCLSCHVLCASPVEHDTLLCLQ